MNDWIKLLEQAVAADPRGISGVADAIGVSRPAVSLVLANKYPAKTDKIKGKVLAVYDRLACPHTGETVTRAACRAVACHDAPTSSPREMRHWRACQACANKPKE